MSLPKPRFARARLALFVAAGLAAMPARAYFSTIDTGDLVAPDHYRAILEPQLILNNYDGGNLVGRFDAGLDRDSSVRAILGFGKVQYQAGAMYKYIPFPDVDKQPAIGGEAGVIFARVNGENEVSVRLHPLISKRFDTIYGEVTPYGSLPIGITSRASETFVPLQIAGGSMWTPEAHKNLHVFAELGLNVNRAFSYISAAIAYDFDDSTLGASRPARVEK